jgi:hypothetical protein
MRFWFEPTGPSNLGFCRALFFGLFFFGFWSYDASLWSGVAEVFWMPIPLFSYLHLPVLSHEVIEILQVVWKVALGFSFVGLFTRFSTFTSFALGVYLLGLPNNFGKTHHSDAIVVLVMGILALSRCGDGWSIDQLIWKTRRKNAPSVKRPVLSGEYRWPVRLVQVLITLVFFGAGVSKIRHSGLDWILSDNLAFLLLERNKYWGVKIAQHTWICKLLAAATVAGEVSFPLVLVNRILRFILVPGMFMIQIGIILLMGINFKQFMICYLFWVPWDRLGRWLLSQLGILNMGIQARVTK